MLLPFNPSALSSFGYFLAGLGRCRLSRCPDSFEGFRRKLETSHRETPFFDLLWRFFSARRGSAQPFLCLLCVVRSQARLPQFLYVFWRQFHLPRTGADLRDSFGRMPPAAAHLTQLLLGFFAFGAKFSARASGAVSCPNFWTTLCFGNGNRSSGYCFGSQIQYALAASTDIRERSSWVPSKQLDQIHFDLDRVRSGESFDQLMLWDFRETSILHSQDDVVFTGAFPVRVLFVVQPARSFADADVERRRTILTEKRIDIDLWYSGISHLAKSLSQVVRELGAFGARWVLADCISVFV